MKSASSSFTEGFREPGTTRLSATAIADLLDMQLQELADFSGVQADTLRAYPESAQLQSALRVLMRLISVARRVEPDLKRSVSLIKEAPISVFGGMTLLQLARAGRTDDAVVYLDSISTGYVG
jgi:hypothetical protein